MRTDARIKQVFPLIVTFLIALGTFSQAQGLAHLFAAHLSAAMPQVKWPQQERIPAWVEGAERSRDGGAILTRNPFDSTTGPLDTSKPLESPGEIVVNDPANPYADPVCESLRVLLITTADDPSWSFAAIAMGREKAALRRVGDDVGHHVVLAMAWDRVWMRSGGIRCQSKLHDDVALIEPKKPLSSAGGRNKVPSDIADKIRHIADYRYEVDRSIIEAVADRQRELLGSVRVVPTRDASGSGLKLRGIRQGSLLGSLGLVDGDVLQTINGFEMSDPMIAMQAYQRLLTADKLDVRVMRGGNEVSIDISMR